MNQNIPGHGGLAAGTTLEYHKPALSTAEVMPNEGPQRERREHCRMETGPGSPSQARYPAVGSAADCFLLSRAEHSHWLNGCSGKPVWRQSCHLVVSERVLNFVLADDPYFMLCCSVFFYKPSFKRGPLL